MISGARLNTVATLPWTAASSGEGSAADGGEREGEVERERKREGGRERECVRLRDCRREGDRQTYFRNRRRSLS